MDEKKKNIARDGGQDGGTKAERGKEAKGGGGGAAKRKGPPGHCKEEKNCQKK